MGVTKAARSFGALHRCRVGCAAALLSAVVGPLGGPLAEAAELKVGYVNLARLFDDYERTRASEQTLEQKGQQKQAELERELQSIQHLQSNLELLNDQSRQTKAKELEEKTDEFQRLRAKSERELLRERNQLGREILDEIEQTINEYAKANGFTMVFEQRALVYGLEADDLTEEILELLNQRYAAKAKRR